MKSTKVIIAIGIALAFSAITALAALSQLSVPNIVSGLAQGGASYIREPAEYVDARVLAADSSETHTVPSGARFVLFSADCVEFYAKTGASAAVPSGDVTDGTASALNPAAWALSGVSQISLISPTACTITLEFYR